MTELVSRLTLSLCCRQFFALAVALVASLIASAISAAPVTFRFEAEVASAFPTRDGAGFPFTVSAGDVISATLTIEPGSPGPIYPQLGSIQFKISGTALVASDFQIKIAHGEDIGIDVPGRIADPNNTPDADGAPIGDSVYVSCSEDGPLFCGVIPDYSDLVFRPTVVFAEPASLLNSTDLATDTWIWNQFSRREMSLLIRDANTGNDIYYIGAYVGPLNLVPEPSSAHLIFILACALTAWSLVSRTLRH
jgi:hypothetical protein